MSQVMLLIILFEYNKTELWTDFTKAMLQGMASFSLFFFSTNLQCLCLSACSVSPRWIIRHSSSGRVIVDELPGAFGLRWCVLGAFLGLFAVCWRGVGSVLVLLAWLWTKDPGGEWQVASSELLELSSPAICSASKVTLQCVGWKKLTCHSSRWPPDLPSGGGANKMNEEGVINATCCIHWTHKAVCPVWGFNM